MLSGSWREAESERETEISPTIKILLTKDTKAPMSAEVPFLAMAAKISGLKTGQLMCFETLVCSGLCASGSRVKTLVQDLGLSVLDSGWVSLHTRSDTGGSGWVSLHTRSKRGF